MGQVGRGEDEWRLLKAVAEQLKLPLLQLARGAELNVSESTLPWRSLQASADAALAMVDSYLYGLAIVEGQLELLLEPVSVPMILGEVAHELNPLAKQYNVELQLETTGKLVPVMTNTLAVRTALVSLGYALVSAPAAQKRPALRLVAHRVRGGVTAGLFGDFELSAASLHQAMQLYGRVAQPLSSLSSGAAGIFVADSILSAMAVPLKSRHHHKQAGLAVTLPLSRQLELI